MKKVLLLFAALAMTIAVASAQSSGQVVFKSDLGGTHIPTDTVINAGTRTQSAPVSFVNKTVTVKVLITKISGTVGGKVILLGSTDNVNFVRVPSLLADNTVGLDSLNAGNVATQAKYFKIVNSNFNFYRSSYTGVGTQSAKLNSDAIYTNRP